LPADPTVPLGRHVLAGEIPSPLDLPPGCAFAGRCPVVLPSCREAEPPRVAMAAGHGAACLRAADGSHRTAAS
jgi:oligopeptide/dipeptide ABC transporter ATP-binding protein